MNFTPKQKKVIGYLTRKGAASTKDLAKHLKCRTWYAWGIANPLYLSGVINKKLDGNICIWKMKTKKKAS